MTLSGTERLSDLLLRARQIKTHNQKIESDYNDVINVLNAHVDIATQQAINISQDVFASLLEPVQQAREGGFLKEYLLDVSSEIVQQVESTWPVGEYAKTERYAIERDFQFLEVDRTIRLDLGIGDQLENEPHNSENILISTQEVFIKLLNDNAQRVKEEIHTDKDLRFLVELSNLDRAERKNKIQEFVSLGKESRFGVLTPPQYVHLTDHINTAAHKIESDVAQMVAEAQNTRENKSTV